MPSPLAALSPLDGRYARSADPLRGYFSEQALIRYRVRIELEWLQALAAERGVAYLDAPVSGGPEGARLYISRLRCGNGASPQIGGRSNGGVGAFGSVVEAFALTCGGSGTRLMFDIYHEEHVETRAPAGFALAS